MSEMKLKKVVRPNYREKDDSPPQRKAPKTSKKKAFAEKSAARRSGTVTRVKFCSHEKMEAKMENTAKIIFTGKTAAQLSQAKEIDTTSAVVPTNYHEEPKR